MRREPLRAVLLAIAALTVLTGLVQLVAPGFVLGILAADRSLTPRHLFAIVGMFMCLFGGALLQALLANPENRLVVFWASLQKFGAAAAVALGVRSGIFSSLALFVAGFDLLSGVLGIVYWRRLAAWQPRTPVLAQPSPARPLGSDVHGSPRRTA